MKRTIVCLVLAIACCSKEWVDVPHPSPQRINELMSLPIPEKAQKAGKPTFQVVVDRSFVMAGGAIRVTCLVPQTMRSAIRLGIANLQTSERPLAAAEESTLVTGVPCGRWTAFCQLATGPLVTADVHGVGGMCEGVNLHR